MEVPILCIPGITRKAMLYAYLQVIVREGTPSNIYITLLHKQVTAIF